VVAWAVAALSSGIVLGSLGLGLPALGWPGSFRPGDAFETSVLAFYAGLTIAVVGFVPLCLLLLGHGRLCSRRPTLERSWADIAAACAGLALASGIGVSVVITTVWLIGVGLSTLLDPAASRDPVPLVFAFFAGLIAGPAFIGLLFGRWLHPDLGPGALIRQPPRVRLVPRARAALLVGGAALLLAVASAGVETKMYVPCDRGRSCSDTVLVRGLPMPYLVPNRAGEEQALNGAAFLYDAVVFGFLATVVLRAVQVVRITPPRAGPPVYR
jgi:hypothetical protein